MNSEKVILRIKQIRLSKDWTQEMTAKALGITQNGYSRLEQGQIKLTLDRLFKIAEEFEISIFQLLSDDPIKIEI